MEYFSASTLKWFGDIDPFNSPLGVLCVSRLLVCGHKKAVRKVGPLSTICYARVLLNPSDDEAHIAALRTTAKVAEVVLNFVHLEVLVGGVGGKTKAVALARNIEGLAHYGVGIEHELNILVTALIHNAICAALFVEIGLVFGLVEGEVHLAVAVDTGCVLSAHKLVHSNHSLILYGTAGCHCECGNYCQDCEYAFHSFADVRLLMLVV